ncbi:rieske family iron-sulfur cluster-binding protein [Roseibium sp. TrichSKD4]|nr:rieske family iron-sulfur cluster-binding protein [Roseibium sp. TrichSKD4]
MPKAAWGKPEVQGELGLIKSTAGYLGFDGGDIPLLDSPSGHINLSR